jgi:hypothetical protein
MGGDRFAFLSLELAPKGLTKPRTTERCPLRSRNALTAARRLRRGKV